MLNRKKIKLNTPLQDDVIKLQRDINSKYHYELVREIVFESGMKTFIDPTMDNYDNWDTVLKSAQVGDTISNLQADPKNPIIYSGDSKPVLIRKHTKKLQDTKPDHSRGLRIVERVDSQLTPEEVSGLTDPQLITLSDDLVFEVGSKLQDSDDLVNVNIIPGGLGLEIYGPKVWLVLAREKKNS